MSTDLPDAATLDPRPSVRVGATGLAALAVVAVAGLAWAKWVPYAEKASALASSHLWPGTSLLDTVAGDRAGSVLADAGTFAVQYAESVWKALVVALLVAAAVDALVPRAWLAGVLGRRTRLGQAAVGGLLSSPGMMCTCCTAPVAVGLRRRGVPLAATLAYWTGNPLLNPAVLVFLLLVLPWQFAAVRLLAGLAVVIGVSGLVARWTERGPGTAPVPDLPHDDPTSVRELPGRYLRSLARLTLVLVPEYAVVVLATGVLTRWLGTFDGMEQRLGVAALVVAALAATLLVIPTGGEIPVIAGLTAVAGAAGRRALLVALPALSAPSMVMVGRALGWRATAPAGRRSAEPPTARGARRRRGGRGRQRPRRRQRAG